MCLYIINYKDLYYQNKKGLNKNMNFENATLDKKAEEKEALNASENQNEEIVVEKAEPVSSEEKAEADLKAADEVEKARKSIFGRIGEMFKGKEKTDEEKYEEDMRSLEKLIKSLTHVSTVSMNLGASFSGSGISFEHAKTPGVINKVNEIVEVNNKLNGLDKGKEKVDLLYKKRELIQDLARIGKREIKEKYNKV